MASLSSAVGEAIASKPTLNTNCGYAAKGTPIMGKTYGSIITFIAFSFAALPNTSYACIISFSLK